MSFDVKEHRDLEV